MQITHFSASPGSVAGAAHSPNIVVIDYGLGNVGSVVNALEALGAQVILSRNEADLIRADGLVLPGVGAFGDGMANLNRFNLIPILEELVLRQKKPFLGICVGMQLLAKRGYEGGEQDGLGWIDAEVVRLQGEALNLKVPHVGWNDVHFRADNARQTYYFVHSYYLKCAEPDIVVAHCEYGIEFPAIIQKENIWAMQFHPEKSQKAGLKLLADFLAFAQPLAKEQAC